MAKKSIIARDKKKELTVQKFAERVRQLKQAIRSEDEDIRFDAITKLNKLPRNASPCRINRRCQVCGRPRAVYRSFGLCRICLRKAAMRGDVTGLSKASW
jgi:small subunit ribosomal protein S14